MLFAGVELAARIEPAERGMLLDGAESIGALPDRDVFVREIAGGVATSDPDWRTRRARAGRWRW
jgi:hypothetical protein